MATPEVRARVVERALRRGHRVEVPEDGPAVAEFVRGPLHAAVRERLGDGAAMAVLEELGPLAERLAGEEVSEVRPSIPWLEIDVTDLLDDLPPNELELELEPPSLLPSSASSSEDAHDAPLRAAVPTHPAPRTELPVIVVASSDPSSVSLLSFALSGLACVEVAGDVLAVLEALGRGTTPIVVLDARHPTIQADTLLAMSPELPDDSRIILWAGDWELDRLATLGAGLPDGWVHCRLDASADDIADVCRVLLG